MASVPTATWKRWEPKTYLWFFVLSKFINSLVVTDLWVSSVRPSGVSSGRVAKCELTDKKASGGQAPSGC